MRNELRRTAVLAWASFLDAARRPATLLTMTSGLMLILALPYIMLFKIGEQARIMRDACLSMQFLLGWLVAALAGAGALHDELRSGTAALALCKPVGRARFLLAKFLGLAMFVSLMTALFAEAVMISVRASMTQYLTDDRILLPALAAPGAAFGAAAVVNAMRNRPFVPLSLALMAVLMTAAFILAASLPLRTLFGGVAAPQMDWRLAPACALVGLSALVACAMAFALSSRLPPPFTISIVALLSVTGLIGPALFGPAHGGGAIPAIAACLLPDFQAFWIADRLSAAGSAVTFADISIPAAYAILYLTAWLCAGLFMFKHAEA